MRYSPCAPLYFPVGIWAGKAEVLSAATVILCDLRGFSCVFARCVLEEGVLRAIMVLS